VAERAREPVYARAKRKKQVVRPETLLLAGWVLLLSTLTARDFAAEDLFWLYRSRWQIDLLIKQLTQFLLLVRLRSSHPDTVRTTVLAALVAWALQEEEAQALLRTLAALPAQGQEGLVQAYLPLLEQWQAGESAAEAADEPRRPVSVWLLAANCLSRWRAVVLGQWSAARVQCCLPRVRRCLCLSPRRRVHQRLWFLAWVQQRFLAPSILGDFPGSDAYVRAYGQLPLDRGLGLCPRFPFLRRRRRRVVT
jgi:hypothetical protein